MADTNIEWADAVWNPTVGCSKVSSGCAHCYAEAMARRLIAMGQTAYEGTVDARGRWTGRINVVESRLAEPLRWKKPRRVFVNSMSDLFHESITDESIDRVFAMMAHVRHCAFLVLTKRPERMLHWFSNPNGNTIVEAIKVDEWLSKHPGPCKEWHRDFGVPPLTKFPLPNVWLGVSVEDQATADERIPLLLKAPAAVRFVSYEPALGPVDFTYHGCRALPVFREGSKVRERCGLTGRVLRVREGRGLCRYDAVGPWIDWLICGGESGRKARPMHPDWARAARDQCVAAGVPFFFKQWGEWGPYADRHDGADGRYGEWHHGEFIESCLCDQGSGAMIRVGKKKAGRLIDGREWNEVPREGTHHG